MHELDAVQVQVLLQIVLVGLVLVGLVIVGLVIVGLVLGSVNLAAVLPVHVAGLRLISVERALFKQIQNYNSRLS